MKIRVLGCSGGIGSDLSTTSFLLDDHIMIDCGTGVGNLTLPEMKKITHIFFTHSHLDHVAGLPLLVDTIFDTLCGKPLVISGSQETITALKTHLFNNVIWPDFSIIPSWKEPVIRFEVIEPGQAYAVDGCELEMIPVNHVVPTMGYRVSCERGTFAFSADTTTNDSFWQRLNELDQLDYLVVECAFANSELEICKLAYHYCPDLLASDLKKLKHEPEIYITHLKPGSEDKIMAECHQQIEDRDFKRLQANQIIDI